MVILVVLGMILVALSFSTQMADVATQLERNQRFIASREANYQVARSAFELALQLVQADDDDVDGPGDLWATGPQSLDWEGHALRIEIQDEERRIPIIRLVPQEGDASQQFEATEAETALRGLVERFLERAGQPADRAVPSLIDWMDADTVPLPGGTERGFNEIPVKNAPIDSFHEFQYIQGLGQPNLPLPLPLAGELAGNVGSAQDSQDPSSNVKAQSQWSDWFSLFGEGKINLNTAPREILLALDEGITDSIVVEIIRRRDEEALEGENDLLEIPGVDEDLAFRLGRLVDYKSSVFRIRVAVENGPGRLKLEAVVLRGDSPEVLLWEVN